MALANRTNNAALNPGLAATKQYDWRFCKLCFSLFWAGDKNGKRGACPFAPNAVHQEQGFNFGLYYTTNTRTSPRAPDGAYQDGWRFCGNCYALFHEGNSDNSRRCPAANAPNGQHAAVGDQFHIAFKDVQPNNGPVAPKIGNAFSAWLKANSITNACLAVVQDGGAGLTGFGYGNRNSKTVVPFASLTKAITAMGIANLVDAGKLSYTDKASTRLSSFFKTITIADPRANDITIEHLLRHTSGLSFDSTQSAWPAGVTNTASADEGFARATLAASASGGTPNPLSGKSLDRVPGTGANNYNNVNYALLGMIIKQVTGQTYEAYCTQTVLNPHNFSAVSIAIPAMGAFGGWQMSVEQYADFIYMHYKKMSAGADAFMNASFAAGYGLGVGLKKTAKGRNIWHFGNWSSTITTPSAFGSYFALWDNELLVVAAYDRSINTTQQGALDAALSKAAGK
jgi:CubicO group peptidase (beta-lactamase class C family)